MALKAIAIIHTKGMNIFELQKINEIMPFSFWEQQSFIHYDALIVGSGIVGLSAAYYLKEKYPTWEIAILERGLFPLGASTKNAGFACFGSISELIEQEKIAGATGLHRLIERRWKGLLRLRRLLGDEAIDFQNNGGFEVFDTSHQTLQKDCFEKIPYYNELIKDITRIPDTFLPANEKIKSFGFGQTIALIENRLEGQIDTGKMMKSLIKKVISKGVLIFNSIEVNQIESLPDKVKIFGKDTNFTCNHLLLATNAFTPKLIKDINVIPGRGQVVITNPIENLKIKGTFHYNKGYFYFRNIGNRVLFGGGRNLDFEGETTFDFGETEKIQNKLEDVLQTIILPEVPFHIENRWSGIMAFGNQITPIIKELQPHVYCGVRSSGMGIAMGTQTGFDLAALCR